MTEYRLSKSNKNTKLQKTDEKHEVAKVKKQKTDVAPTGKNYIANVVNSSTEICIKTFNGLVKTTGHALTVVGNKLAKVDWGNVLLQILLALITANTKGNSNNQYYYQSSSSRNYKNHPSGNSPKRTKKTKEKTSRQQEKQIDTSKQQEKHIEVAKEKQLNSSKTKSIKTNDNTKQLRNKKDNEKINIKQNHLMIEKKRPNKD